MSNPEFKFDHLLISNDPEASAYWYVEMFGATITANTTAPRRRRSSSIWAA